MNILSLSKLWVKKTRENRMVKLVQLLPEELGWNLRDLKPHKIHTALPPEELGGNLRAPKPHTIHSSLPPKELCGNFLGSQST